jgi:hypothetical protein
MGGEGNIRSYIPPPYIIIPAPFYLAFHGLAYNREIILRSADYSTQQSVGNGCK